MQHIIFCKKYFSFRYYKMSNFDDSIEKLLRRIQRAAGKNKWNKVERLTQQLNQLQELAEQYDEQEALGEGSRDNGGDVVFNENDE